MYPGRYLEEHAGSILFQIFLMLVLGSYLLATGTRPEAIVWIIVIWVVIAGVYLGGGYYSKKRRYEKVMDIFDHLQEKYLFAEIIPKPQSTMERLYFDCSRGANKAMLDRIESLSLSGREYKEYIESWIHEVKNPIAAIDLYCKNHPSEDSREIHKRLKELENLVNQALYYARSGYVEKDYFVQECSISDPLVMALQENRSLILEKHIGLEVEDLEELVYTDPKWVGFILNQVLSNAIKYVENNTGLIRIFVEKEEKGLWLCVEDNGCGIPAADLPRVCEKGFTGSDRRRGQATGMGLYLAKRLCEKLGLTLKVRSELGKGTQIKIGFPVGTLTRP